MDVSYGWQKNMMSCPMQLLSLPFLARNPTFVSNEFKKMLPHPDGDSHTMLNAWNAASWLQQLTMGMDTEPATRIWGKYNLSQRQFEVLKEYRGFVAEKCSRQFSISVEQLEPNQAVDKNAMSRLSFILIQSLQDIVISSKFGWPLLYDK